MRVLVTGASGLCGSSVVPLLASRGHHVTALVRSQESAAKVKANGAHETVIGDLTTLDVLAEEAAKADGVIHLAYDHESAFVPGGMAIAAKKDLAAIFAMCEALLRSGASTTGEPKVFVNTTGTLGNDGEDETSRKAPWAQAMRGDAEDLTRSYSEKGLRTMNVRLPPVTHGSDREHPFVSVQIAKAKDNGYVSVIGEGANPWPSVHVKDAAGVFVLGLEKAPAGVNLQAVQEEGIPVKSLADFIGKKLGLPTKSVTAEDVASWGFVGHVITMGAKATSNLTKKWLDWEPKECTLFEQIEQNYKL
jgi:nucleoside-diphosphate-sugar epimerase